MNSATFSTIALARLLVDKLRIGDPTLAHTDLKAERAALEAAIQHVERDAARRAVPPKPNPAQETYDAPDIGYQDRPPLRDGRTRWGLIAGALAATLILIIIGVAYSFWPRVVSSVRSTPRTPALTETADFSKTNYVHLRQLVFYRTNQPVGTIIVDKTQTFLYVVRPNVSALRYSIGVGAECVTLTGLYHVVRKEERAGGNQAVQQSADTSSDPALGARVLYLNDNYRIHGSNASETTDRITREGCIRLVNDDVIYLYDHTPLENRVLVAN